MENYMNKPEVKKREPTRCFRTWTMTDWSRARCARRHQIPVVQHADQPGLVSISLWILPRWTDLCSLLQGDGMHNSGALLPELVDDGIRLLLYAGQADMRESPKSLIASFSLTNRSCQLDRCRVGHGQPRDYLQQGLQLCQGSQLYRFRGFCCRMVKGDFRPQGSSIFRLVPQRWSHGESPQHALVSVLTVRYPTTIPSDH